MANLNLNKVIIGGRVCADIECKKTQSDISVASFTVAVNRKKGEETDFFRVTAWRGTAEFIAKYFHKGSSICIVGTLQTRKWTDKEGNNRESVEIVADEALFVDSKGEGGTYIPDAYTSPAKMEDIDSDENLPF